MVHVRAPARAGHVSDSFGASATGYSDGDGNSVTIRVTEWASSSNDTVSDPPIVYFDSTAQSINHNKIRIRISVVVSPAA